MVCLEIVKRGMKRKRKRRKKEEGMEIGGRWEIYIGVVSV